VQLFVTLRKTKNRYQIPTGKITYSDLNIPAKPFFSPRYRLAGKPDYVLQKDHHYIPVERKSGSSSVPQHNHRLQLAAYCQLLEETYDGFVPYGVLVYNNTSYTIAFDPQLRFELELAITKMRISLKQGGVTLNHQEPKKCKSCSMRRYCAKKLI
jgi:CRISPR-associated protein Cas4